MYSLQNTLLKHAFRQASLRPGRNLCQDLRDVKSYHIKGYTTKKIKESKRLWHIEKYARTFFDQEKKTARTFSAKNKKNHVRTLDIAVRN